MQFSKSEMMDFYFENPIKNTIVRTIDSSEMKYFYFNKDLKIKTKIDEVLNGCLLSGNTKIIYNQKFYELNQFDFFFLPSDVSIIIKVQPKNRENLKICIYSYYIKTTPNTAFEIQRFDMDKLLARGEQGSEEKMATFRTVWTAIKNGYFMSGFTNIPNESLRQGTITSVNLEENKDGKREIYSHIHPEYPEVYIMCIDDPNYAITQYLINTQGQSICRDLQNGDGLFFPGELGHCNFAKPLYKELKYCMYMWIIPTYGKTDTVNPITLKI
jgi:hypothetical protein